jgi:hypothetical protein
MIEYQNSGTNSQSILFVHFFYNLNNFSFNQPFAYTTYVSDKN